MKRISFIVPAFNAEETLPRCLDSILSQINQEDLEIIVINDGSTDSTLNIVMSYQLKHDNIKIINQQNKGISGARNVAIKSATGEYVILVDSDDCIEKDLVKTLYPHILKHTDCIKYNAVFVGGDFDPKDDRFFAEIFNEKSGEDALAIFANGEKIFATPWMYAIKTDLYNKNNLYFSEGRYHEDIGLMPLLIAKSKTVTSLNYVGYDYIQNPKSVVNDMSYEKEIKMAYDFLFHFRRLHNEIDKMDMKESNRRDYYSYLSKKLLKKVKHLHGEEQNKFVLELEKEKVSSYIVDTRTYLPNNQR